MALRPSRRWTIDELAHRTGVSSRNIRYYQTRGLLPPPEVEGRTGYYDRRHVERLELIAELQSEGLNLQAIGWLLGGASTVDTGELRRLKRALLDGWSQEQPQRVAVADVLTWFGAADDLTAEEAEAHAARAEELGLLRRDPEEGDVEVRLPSVLAAGRELAEIGASLDRQLDVLAGMREHAAAIAAQYAELFDDVVLAAWDARGRPEDEWTEVRRSLERLRPLAGEALLAVFHQVMVEAVAERIERAGHPDPEGPAAG